MRLYEITLPREPQTHVPRCGQIEARTAREAKIKAVRAAGWGHCMWTMWNTRVRWIR